jgi:transcriptional regulator with XRE-family HTH domain
LCIPPKSHTVILKATPLRKNYHSLFGASRIAICDNADMAEDKNAGPNHLQAWRVFRDMTQAELAEKVGTSQNMIGYLESGERGLSAKWLRRLAPALKTTPGMLLDHDPSELSADILDIWGAADVRQRRQIADIAKTIVRTGTDD